MIIKFAAGGDVSLASASVELHPDHSAPAAKFPLIYRCVSISIIADLLIDNSTVARLGWSFGETMVIRFILRVESVKHTLAQDANVPSDTYELQFPYSSRISRINTWNR